MSTVLTSSRNGHRDREATISQLDRIKRLPDSMDADIQKMNAMLLEMDSRVQRIEPQVDAT